MYDMVPPPYWGEGWEYEDDHAADCGCDRCTAEHYICWREEEE